MRNCLCSSKIPQSWNNTENDNAWRGRDHIKVWLTLKSHLGLWTCINGHQYYPGHPEWGMYRFRPDHNVYDASEASVIVPLVKYVNKIQESTNPLFCLYHSYPGTERGRGKVGRVGVTAPSARVCKLSLTHTLWASRRLPCASGVCMCVRVVRAWSACACQVSVSYAWWSGGTHAQVYYAILFAIGSAGCVCGQARYLLNSTDNMYSVMILSVMMARTHTLSSRTNTPTSSTSSSTFNDADVRDTTNYCVPPTQGGRDVTPSLK